MYEVHSETAKRCAIRAETYRFLSVSLLHTIMSRTVRYQVRTTSSNNNTLTYRIAVRTVRYNYDCTYRSLVVKYWYVRTIIQNEEVVQRQTDGASRLTVPQSPIAAATAAARTRINRCRLHSKTKHPHLLPHKQTRRLSAGGLGCVLSANLLDETMVIMGAVR